MSALAESTPPVKRTTYNLPTHTRLKVNCGCGESFEHIELGEAHAQTTGHTLHIHGEIRPNR